MNNWQVVPRRKASDGIQFRLHGATGNKLTIYIGSGLSKRIKDYKRNGWCNVYRKDDNLMVQIIYKPDGQSRKVSNSVFSLPYSVVEAYWKDEVRRIEIPAVVEKGNLILLDLRDLGK